MTGIELSVERWTVVDSSLSSDLGKGLPRSRVRAHALQGKGTGDSKLGKQEPGGSGGYASRAGGIETREVSRYGRHPEVQRLGHCGYLDPDPGDMVAIARF